MSDVTAGHTGIALLQRVEQPSKGFDFDYSYLYANKALQLYNAVPGELHDFVSRVVPNFWDEIAPLLDRVSAGELIRQELEPRLNALGHMTTFCVQYQRIVSEDYPELPDFLFQNRELILAYVWVKEFGETPPAVDLYRTVVKAALQRAWYDDRQDIASPPPRST